MFGELRRFAEEGRKFDLGGARSAEVHRIAAGADARLPGVSGHCTGSGFGLLAPGGLLFNFSCSGLMTPELFQKITADAAVEAGGAAAGSSGISNRRRTTRPRWRCRKAST